MPLNIHMSVCFGTTGFSSRESGLLDRVHKPLPGGCCKSHAKCGWVEVVCGGKEALLRGKLVASNGGSCGSRAMVAG